MSKYVRTKDNIYARDYLKIDLGGTLCSRISFNQVIDAVSKKDIIKQADTIEELVDLYAVVLKHQDSPLIVYKNEIEHYKHCLVDKVKSNNRVLVIYGAIWVDDNLIKVAKMNDKGELELL